MAGTSAKAKKLLLRTVAQFNAVRSHEDVPSTASSYRAIDRWFAPGDGSAGHAFEGYRNTSRVAGLGKNENIPKMLESLESTLRALE